MHAIFNRSLRMFSIHQSSVKFEPVLSQLSSQIWVKPDSADSANEKTLKAVLISDPFEINDEIKKMSWFVVKEKQWRAYRWMYQ